MSKDLLTKEELDELLASPRASAEKSHIPSPQSADRNGDLSEITLRYWQQTVVQMQRELAELRQRVDVLEKAKGVSQLKPVSKNKTPAGSQQGPAGKPDGGKDTKPDATLSRKEKFKSQRGKWF